MTRKHKFQTGDLVVLKKPVRVVSWPDSTFDKAFRDAITSKTKIRHVVHGSRSYAATTQPGSIGIIKGYENVFMLTREPISKERYKALPADIKAEQTVIFKNYYETIYLNSWARKHMIVLIDGMLVAFASGGKLFEHADDAMQRHATATTHLSLSFTLNRVSDKELETKTTGLMNRLTQMGFVDVRVSRVDYTDREGVVTMKEGKDGQN